MPARKVGDRTAAGAQPIGSAPPPHGISILIGPGGLPSSEEASRAPRGRNRRELPAGSPVRLPAAPAIPITKGRRPFHPSDASPSARTPMIVTIDGPAGAGKTSAARRLARRLGFHFLDTGAMYRAVTLAGKHRGVDWTTPRNWPSRRRAHP